MSNNLNIEKIMQSFRTGKDSSFINSDVLPLFIIETPLFKKYNSILKNEFLSALKESRY